MMFEYLAGLTGKGFIPKNVLDIGANFGNFSARCKAEIWPVLTNFYLIEANEECRFNLMMTGFPIFINLLSDVDEKIIPFYKTKDVMGCTGNSTYREKTIHYTDDHVVIVNKKTITLDTLFKDKNIKFDFAKLDTQGSELDILKGGRKTLSTCKYILIEVSLKYYNEGVPLKDDIIKFMKEFSFNKYDIVEQTFWQAAEPLGDIHHGDLYQEDIMFYK
jgi:FkbM family methyltransferase